MRASTRTGLTVAALGLALDLAGVPTPRSFAVAWLLFMVVLVSVFWLFTRR